MAFCDFVIMYNPDTDTMQDIAKRILYSIITRRLKNKKPVVMFIAGQSGEGKSFGALKLQEVLLEMQGLKLVDYLDAINVYTPLEYPTKLDALLFSKELKKVNLICMHEAREVVKAKNWQSFLTQSIADVNAMSRSVKRLCIIVISQFIRDITSDVRHTINYYIKASRPKGRSTRLYFNVIWYDDRDLEKPKIRKRKLSGYLVYPDGRYRRFVPKYLEVSKPSKEAIERFEKSDYEAKAGIIRKKLNKLIKEMQLDISDAKENKKIDSMVNWYMKNQENIFTIGKRYKGAWKLTPEAKQMHDLDDREAKQFEEKLNDRLKQTGALIEDGKENIEEM